MKLPNPLAIIGGILGLVQAVNALALELRLTRIALETNTAATRDNTAVLRDESTRAMSQLAEELRAQRQGAPWPKR